MLWREQCRGGGGRLWRVRCCGGNVERWRDLLRRKGGGQDQQPTKTGSRSMIECRTCKMWVDLESCKGLNEMSQSERNKLVFDCWKCMVDERVKMADVNMKKEEEIKKLKAEVVFLRRELENGRKLKGGKDVRSKRRVDGDVNDSVRRISEGDERSRVNEKMNGPWAKGNGRRMIEKNGIDENEQNRINEKMHGPWKKSGWKEGK
ncbi:hypothetical protein FHG87_013712 [Trinorchestia longiramus]|nr:hypothetical protein FHG87_013712 [Trinorchestia longiramus]